MDADHTLVCVRSLTQTGYRPGIARLFTVH